MISFKFFKTKLVEQKQYEGRFVSVFVFVFDKPVLPTLSLYVTRYLQCNLDELFPNPQNLKFVILVCLTHLQHIFSEQASSTKDSLFGEFRRRHEQHTFTILSPVITFCSTISVPEININTNTKKTNLIKTAT